MRTLLLGSGGRESALAWSLAKSSVVDELFAGPGNPGIADHAEIVAVDPDDPDSVVALVRSLNAELTVVGPEAPLVAGVGDALRADGRLVFGPNAGPALIEGSKTFAKELMLRAGIPTAAARTCTTPAEAIAALDDLGPPYVVKADGLAAGKGVVVTSVRTEAVAAVEERMVARAFGSAGDTVVIEEFLEGPEASVIAFTDGKVVVPCEPAQDFKRLADADAGPNTGGMGSYSPVPACASELVGEIVDRVLEPMVSVLAADNPSSPFIGALYAGLALTPDGPRVIEFNARFGDPETQALLPRLRSDLGEVCLACASGDAGALHLSWTDDVCVAVVLAASGYPGAPRTGDPISGLEAATGPGVHVFHAGTAKRGDEIVTSGGRVLAVAATAPSFSEARALAYRSADVIEFEGKHVRRDIAARPEGLAPPIPERSGA